MQMLCAESFSQTSIQSDITFVIFKYLEKGLDLLGKNPKTSGSDGAKKYN